MISVLILTYQEEANIGACLDALAWCDDIVVLDSFSTDRTVNIACERGARVLQRSFDDFAAQRNYGIQHGGFRHEWVLHLDADEIVPPALRDEITASVRDAAFDAFRVPSKMMFEGRWLKYAGMYPTYQVRLGHRERLRFHQVGHGQRETLPANRIGTLRSGLLHYSFSKGLEEWFAKHNRYSTDEAREQYASRARDGRVRVRITDLRDSTTRRRTLKRVFATLPFRPTLRFVYMFLWRRGFLDGAAGFRYARLLAIYEEMSVLKLWELRSGVHGRDCRTDPSIRREPA